ncbi:hypothetical protein RGC64_06690 [Helicobacter pylori]|nr:hypothetical protein [Helicobacter pylori]MDU9774771.1 hypothetical protein [Helicobacter pylori]
MILENACAYKDYLASVFDAMGFYGSFEVVGNNIKLNIIPKDGNETPTKDQVLEKLKEITLKQKKQELENQIIETTTRLLTSYQIFLNQARENATNQINTNKTQAITNINEAKTTANNEISTNKTESLEAITQSKRRSLSKH